MSAYREEIIEHPHYLHIRICGRWSVQRSQRSWNRIANLLSARKTSKLLLDERDLAIDTSVSIDYEHGEAVVKSLGGLCRRVAMVDIPENSEIDRFFETVCVNRGLNMKYFLQEQQAIDWLLED